MSSHNLTSPTTHSSPLNFQPKDLDSHPTSPNPPFPQDPPSTSSPTPPTSDIYKLHRRAGVQLLPSLIFISSKLHMKPSHSSLHAARLGDDTRAQLDDPGMRIEILTSHFPVAAVLSLSTHRYHSSISVTHLSPRCRHPSTLTTRTRAPKQLHQARHAAIANHERINRSPA